MKHPKIVWLLILILGTLSVITPSSLSQIRERNLAEYKQGPLFDLKNEYSSEGNQEKAPARQFLWELWSSRTKGFFDVTSYSREADPSTCRYFVEPSENGQWRIASECVYKGRCPYTSKKKCRELYKTIYSSTYDTMEREDSILILKDSTSGRKDEF